MIINIWDRLLPGIMSARMCVSGGVLEWNLTSMTPKCKAKLRQWWGYTTVVREKVSRFDLL